MGERPLVPRLLLLRGLIPQVLMHDERAEVPAWGEQGDARYAGGYPESTPATHELRYMLGRIDGRVLGVRVLAWHHLEHAEVIGGSGHRVHQSTAHQGGHASHIGRVRAGG